LPKKSSFLPTSQREGPNYVVGIFHRKGEDTHCRLVMVFFPSVDQSGRMRMRHLNIQKIVMFITEGGHTLCILVTNL
jgi:hypothetical protein